MVPLQMQLAIGKAIQQLEVGRIAESVSMRMGFSTSAIGAGEREVSTPNHTAKEAIKLVRSGLQGRWMEALR